MKGNTKMNKVIPVFFTVDDNYAPFLATALNSAVRNSDEKREYVAKVLYRDLSDENISKLRKFERDNFKIDFVPMRASFDELDDRMSNRLRCDYFTLTIYFRLFIPFMFPEYDKGIYLDSDVIVTDDLAKMFDIDIGDNFVGACNDLSIADILPLVAYTENAIGVKKEEYVNSGVLLMNLCEMRRANLEGHFLDLLSTYHFDSIAPDQDYLNAMCNGRIFYLENAWDAMPNESREALKKTHIIHYNLFSKPWCYDGIQYAEYFWKYAEDSGYIDEIKAFKDGYCDEKKKADSDCLELLIRRATEIPQNDVTFKKMHESGVKIRL